tara:strand:+ start:5576 stop:6565 length:990 start_codon:yes stop_codon:yes gene_type:complete
MIVNLFRHTQWLSIFVLFIASTLLWSIFSFSSFEFGNPNKYGPFELLISSFAKPIFIQRLLLGLFIFAQCLYFNKIIVNQRIISINSLFPAFFYFLILTSFPNSIQWSSILISLVFILLALKKILTLYLKKEAYTTIFDAALMIGIACIIHPPFIIFAPSLWIGMSIFSQVEWRLWVLSFGGLTLPWLIFYTIVSSGIIPKLNMTYIVRAFKPLKASGFKVTTEINYGDYITLGFLFIIVLVAIYELISGLKYKNIRARKSYILLMWMTLMGFIFIYTSHCSIFLSFICLAIPLSAIISNYFYYHKNSIWLNFLLFIFITLILVNHLMI